MTDPADELRQVLARTVALIAETDQLGAAARDARANMLAGLNAEQAAYLTEQAETFRVALHESPIHPDHYDEAAEALWDQFGPTIARQLAALAGGASDGA